MFCEIIHFLINFTWICCHTLSKQGRYYYKKAVKLNSIDLRNEHNLNLSLIKLGLNGLYKYLGCKQLAFVLIFMSLKRCLGPTYACFKIVCVPGSETIRWENSYLFSQQIAAVR